MDSINNTQQNNICENSTDDIFAIKKSNDDIQPTVPTASGSFIKVNGDHRLPDNFFQNDEETSSSTNSSSSHNLIIDQPEEINFNIVSGGGSGDNEANDNNIGKKLNSQTDRRNIPTNIVNPLKRKHITYENGSPEHKQLHLMDRQQSPPPPPLPPPPPPPSSSSERFSPHPRFNIKSPTHSTIENRSSDHNENNRKKEKRLKGGTSAGTTKESKGNNNEDHFQEYAKYLKLKPTVKYKCFKCYNNTFETLTQLRNHQKICLFKENHRHSSQDGNSFDANIYSSNSSNLSGDNIQMMMLPTNEQIQARLEKQYAETKTTPKAKKKVFLCAACGTYYENWNLFLHMREVHRRHICLYCVGMFPTAERLTLHLEMKHDLEQNHFESHEKLLRASRDTCYLMCCICEHIFTEHEEFQDHNCSELIPPCSLCGQKGRHTANCRSLHSERSSKEKPKRKSKMNKEITAHSKKQDNLISNMNLNVNENIRLTGDNMYDAKKMKVDDNTNHWSFKVNGCITETSVKAPEIVVPPRDNIITNQIHHTPETAEPQNQPLNLTNLNNLTNEMQQILNPGNINALSEVLSTERIDQYLNYRIDDEQNGNVQILENMSKIQSENEHPAAAATIPEAVPNPNDTTWNSNYQNVPLQNISPYNPDQLENKINDELETPPNTTEISQKEEEQKPLFVPKFTIKIPKEYQAPLESEHSSTESDEEEQEQSVNGGDLSDENQQDDLHKKDDQREDVENMAVEENETLPSDDCSKQEDKPEEESNMEKEIFDESNKEDINSSISSEEAKEEEPPADGIAVASDDVLAIELLLDRPIDKISMIEFLRICLRSTYPICLYCNHARRIAVNGNSLALHMLEHHRFSATVDSITAEELQPATITGKLKNFLPDLEDIFFNMETYCSSEKDVYHPYEKIFECFLCRFETKIHKELYLHNRKMHLKTAILCFMCRANFFSYSEILCHMCPGMPNKCVIFDIKFRCCLCDIDQIPSAFRLMVHLRKKHFACDVCLEDCQDQSKLSSHVWKHKLHHLCYRCGIAYRNKPDITKHLFWKHGTESVLCKRCLQKRWPHVYHFCIPPPSFVCEICNIAFSRAMFLKVHKRLHAGDAPYPCTEDDCDKKFISRRLLLKHVAQHTEETEIKVQEEEKKEIELKVEDADNEKIEEVQNEEISKKEEEEGEVTKKDTETSKKKRKKVKKEHIEENIDDLMNLPAPNLSESDSSDDSDSIGGKIKPELLSPHVPKVMLSPLSDNGEDEKDAYPTPMMDIWENFKTFQAKQNKNKKDENDLDTDMVPIIPILHVNQSDHDYCMMYKAITKEVMKDDDKLETTRENKTELSNTDMKMTTTPTKDTATPKSKKQKSPRKGTKSGSDSSSSGSSSGSDSSCSCGSNCSCSSSSGSSSDSSSSSEDSDSSTSEGRKRIAAKRAAKEEKRNRSKSENSSKANTSDVVDVVTTDTKPNETINFNSIILETDLETDESETDEDFYDEHPQKLASQLLAEKRKQLMMQTCLSPSHNFDIVENSRPSTPSLPEEVMKQKKVKIKKKKREKKGTKSGVIIPTFKLNIPNILAANTTNQQSTFEQTAAEIPLSRIDSVCVPSLPPPSLLPPPIALLSEPINLSPSQSQQQQISQNRISTTIPAPVTSKNRLSTGSSSDADGPLKRSKRARRPNKFYGYTSDDDSMTPHLTGIAAFKPTPPPNLTWRKEDLPTPSKSITNKSNKTSSNASKKNKESLTNAQPLPPIPPIIIRPSTGLLQSKINSSATETDLSINKPPPPIIEPLRVPPVPVHHIQPPQNYPSSRESVESESSDEDRLHIPIPTKAQFKSHYNKKQQQRHQRQQKQQRQQQLLLHQQQQQQYQHQPQQYQQQQLQQQYQQQQQQYQHQQYVNPILTGLNQQHQQQHITPGTITSNIPQQIPTPTPAPQQKIPPALLPNPDLATLQYFQRNHIRWPIRPPAGARPPREGESVYCYCRCPYDEVSEMIACDGDDCMIEWFHFECIGIMVPPKGKWFCPECRPNYPHEVMTNESYENT